jgi:hypothetical protein
LLPSVSSAANEWIEPILANAASCSNGGNAQHSRRSERSCYAYFDPKLKFSASYMDGILLRDGQIVRPIPLTIFSLGFSEASAS